jgi:hypothetical protein
LLSSSFQLVRQVNTLDTLWFTAAERMMSRGPIVTQA